MSNPSEMCRLMLILRRLKCDEAPEEPPSITSEKVLKIACNITITTNYMHTGIADVSAKGTYRIICAIRLMSTHIGTGRKD